MKKTKVKINKTVYLSLPILEISKSLMYKFCMIVFNQKIKTMQSSVICTEFFENKKEHNLKWSYIPDHPYRTLIIGGFGSGKTNALLNLINNQPDIDKTYLHAKVPYEAKYQFLINQRESTGWKLFNDPKAFIECRNDMQDLYRNIEEYNAGKSKILIVFDDMIADRINNKNLIQL